MLLCKVTRAPPVGAARFRVTVPVELAPPTTEVGLLPIEDSVTAFTVRVAVFVVPNVPEIVTEAFDVIWLVVMVKVAFADPAAIVTLAGT